LKKGEKLSLDNVLVKCAEPHGIRPNLLDQLLGHEISKDIPYDVTIDASWVKDWNPDNFDGAATNGL
jgi:sialic acid synthase SpsE